MLASVARIFWDSLISLLIAGCLFVINTRFLSKACIFVDLFHLSCVAQQNNVSTFLYTIQLFKLSVFQLK